MVLMLGLCSETPKIIVAVKNYLERMWYARYREQSVCWVVFVFSLFLSLQELECMLGTVCLSLSLKALSV